MIGCSSDKPRETHEFQPADEGRRTNSHCEPALIPSAERTRTFLTEPGVFPAAALGGGDGGERAACTGGRYDIRCVWRIRDMGARRVSAAQSPRSVHGEQQCIRASEAVALGAELSSFASIFFSFV